MNLEIIESFIHPVKNFKELVGLTSNLAVLINNNLNDVNWCGFYFKEDSNLLLGPFVGKTARERIKIGSGVCGVAFRDDKTVIVKNVQEFSGHIACDIASNSELVVPFYNRDGDKFGVIDLDSTKLTRFTSLEAKEIEEISEILSKNIYF